MDKIKEVMDIVKEMTVLELNELVKTFEKEFGVSASNPIVSSSSDSEKNKEKEADKEEKTEFNVILNEVGESRTSVIRAVRDITGLGLKESKDAIDKVPTTIKENVSKEIANEIKSKLEAAGAKVELK